MSTPTLAAIDSVRLLELLDYDKRSFALHLAMLDVNGQAELVSRILDGFGPHTQMREVVEHYHQSARSLLGLTDAS